MCWHVCTCVNIFMSMWVTHHYLVRWDSSSDSRLSASLLHTEPSEPSAVYTRLLLLFTLSLFISLSHSHAHPFSLCLSLTFSLHLPPAPRSTSPFLTHSTLSCVLHLFSLTVLPPSLFSYASTSAKQLLLRLRQCLTAWGFVRHSGSLVMWKSVARGGDGEKNERQDDI